MAFEQKDGTGALFKNDDKVEGDNRPNAKGKCKIAGVEYFVSAWTRTSASGVRYQSLAFQPANEGKSIDVRDHHEFDDDVPF